MADLITVPTFIFEQGDLLDGGEIPIQVMYYRDGVITLKQGNDEIIIQMQYLQPLTREIKKHFDQAEKMLKR